MNSSTGFVFYASATAMFGSAVVAGVFFGFSSFIMKALAQVSDDAGVAAMRSINVVVINPSFLGTFLGTGVVSVLVSLVPIFSRDVLFDIILLLASAAYLVGCVGVTMVCNVPLNDRLANPALSGSALSSFWKEYTTRWAHWNHVRTAASFIASVLYAVALFRMG